MLWVYGVISNHIPPGHAHCPTQSYAHSIIFNTFVPAKCTNRVADLQEQLFSLFFLDSSKYRSPQQVSRSEDDRLRESFPVTAKIVSKNTHVRKRFLFFYSVLLHCQILRPTIHSSIVCQCSAYMSALSANRQHPLKILARMAAINGSTTGGHGFGCGKVWPVEKWSDITSKTHIILLSRDIIWNVFLVFIQSLMHLSGILNSVGYSDNKEGPVKAPILHSVTWMSESHSEDGTTTLPEDTGLNGNCHCQSCSGLAPSAHPFKSILVPLHFWIFRPQLLALSSMQESCWKCQIWTSRAPTMDLNGQADGMNTEQLWWWWCLSSPVSIGSFSFDIIGYSCIATPPILIQRIQWTSGCKTLISGRLVT